MNRIEELKEEVKERWSANDVVEVCLKIIDAMNELPDEELQMLTFTSFKGAVAKQIIDEELLRAVALLANTSIDALESRLLFIDDDDREYEIQNSDLADARRQGVFIHPESGNPVDEFESKIIPFFVPSEKFKKLRME